MKRGLATGEGAASHSASGLSSGDALWGEWNDVIKVLLARKGKEKIHRTIQRQVTLIMQAAVRPITTIQPFIARSGNRCAKHERDSGPESQTMFFRGFSFRLRRATDSRHAPRSANRGWPR